MKKVAWGILSTADIGMGRVIPAMQQSALCDIAAICSRSLQRAQAAAQQAGIPKAYGSYEELLADPSIEAIYNPLPNHLHVDWTIKAMQAGKQVLCEKPLGMNAEDAKRLIGVRDATGMKVMEAFAPRVHPQWLKVLELVQSGRIGELRAVQGSFSYYNIDPDNVRNRADIGGGGIMDIGCYPITMSRFIFGTEPRRVISLVQRDPALRTDRLASYIIEFPNGQGTFMCSTQIARHQCMQFFGTRGHIELAFAFGAPSDRPCRIIVDDGRDALGSGIEVIEIPPCNQYSIQGDVFSRAIREDSELPLSLESSVLNMRVIDAIFRSEQSGQWEVP